MRPAALAAATALVLSACGPGSTPCKSCPNVAGTYDVTMASTTPDQSSCGTLYYQGGSGQLRITQAGSTLGAYAGPDQTPIHGTLMEDSSIMFSGFPDTADNGVPLSDVLSGKFSGKAGAWHFDGHLEATSTNGNYPCDASTTFTGDEVGQ